jgi:ectoine hydroxylase-related dioxygenase (phytanoyl-CoA dioxygenase family)
MSKSTPIRLNQKKIQAYWRDGFIVIDSGIDRRTLDATVNDFEECWKGNLPAEIPSHEVQRGHIQKGAMRIRDGWKMSQNCKAIATAPTILQILQELYAKRPIPFQTLNFPIGTEQETHSDAIHFNSEPFGYICGVWVALEKIGKQQGPVVYYPGSNAIPEPSFRMIGQEADYANYEHLLKYWSQQIQRLGFKPQYATLRKGQALIWSANILHGGSKQTRQDLSRHSQVTHYYFENAKLWRPGQSQEQRAFFTPEPISNS